MCPFTEPVRRGSDPKSNAQPHDVEQNICAYFYRCLNSEVAARRAHKIMETLSNDDFEFLNSAPPSQRWRKDARVYKRQRTMVAEQVQHRNRNYFIEARACKRPHTMVADQLS
jgi:hypothetical protein